VSATALDNSSTALALAVATETTAAALKSATEPGAALALPCLLDVAPALPGAALALQDTPDATRRQKDPFTDLEDSMTAEEGGMRMHCRLRSLAHTRVLTLENAPARESDGTRR